MVFSTRGKRKRVVGAIGDAVGAGDAQMQNFAALVEGRPGQTAGDVACFIVRAACGAAAPIAAAAATGAGVTGEGMSSFLTSTTGVVKNSGAAGSDAAG